MRRYLRVLGLFWSASLAAEMEYRTNFTLAAVVALGNLAGSVLTMFLLTRSGYTPGGWTFEQTMLIVGCFTLMSAFVNAALRVNLSRIVRHVRTGTLDFVLLKPIDSQFWLSARNFSMWGLPNVAYGLILLGWAAASMDLGPWRILAGLVPLGLGLVILYGLWFILGATSIWFVKIHNVTHLLNNLLEAGRYPVSSYPVAYQWFFTFVVPVAFMTTVPANLMRGEAGLGRIAASGGIALASLALSRAFWRFALRHYTSASS